MADSSDEFESDLSCESEYESVESSDEWEPITDSLNLIGSTANCTLNLPLRKHIFFAGNSKLKITRSVKTICQPKRERCSLLVMGSWGYGVFRFHGNGLLKGYFYEILSKIMLFSFTVNFSSDLSRK